MRLSKDSKKIIWNRLFDKNIKIDINDLDNLNLYSISLEDFKTMNDFYTYVINNFYSIDRINENEHEQHEESIDNITLDSYYITVEDIINSNKSILNDSNKNDDELPF